ncbi:MAG TPA: delta-aminolevulinic acid dehydratase [Bacteroidales bacterium]|nr:delta-aminolevulinic acid dehydratase [Bacteroidales bacterium]
MKPDDFNSKIVKSFERLHAWCELQDYKGWDPYDGLNSKLFKSIPFVSGSRLAKLFWIQLFKKSPLNFRPLTGVAKDYNPKAVGLFLSGFCNLQKKSPDEHYISKIRFFSGKLIELKSPGYSGAGWGYNFDWQARAFFQPQYTPTVVATTFAGCALLDAYDVTGDSEYLYNARSACDFILKDLNRTYDEKGNFSFSYSPLDKSVVYNASLLGSRMLSRVYSYTGEQNLIIEARKSVEFCCDNQAEDGSWTYGQQVFHKWIDNFHTGYNLECLSDFARYSGDHSFDAYLERGLKYYFRTFFTNDGVPKYYNNSVYPVDIHSSAQLIVTACKTGSMDEKHELIKKVINRTIDNMQSSDGYFYYQLNRYFSSRIPYMRWAQAWMFYALSMYLLHSSVKFHSLVSYSEANSE